MGAALFTCILTLLTVSRADALVEVASKDLSCFLKILRTAVLTPMGSNLRGPRVYITHYGKVPQRLVKTMEMLNQQGLGALVVKSFDREDLTEAQLDCILAMIRSNATKAYYKRDPTYFVELSRMGVVSLYMKHFAVYYHMLLHGVQSALILEDDAYMESNANLLQYMRDMMAAMPSTWELAVIGGRFADHAQGPGLQVITNATSTNSRLVQVNKGFNSRCTHAYLLRITAVLKMFRW